MSEQPTTKPSHTHLLFAAVVVMALIVVSVFVLQSKSGPEPEKENTKFKQDVVTPKPPAAEKVNTAINSVPVVTPQKEVAPEPQAPVTPPEKETEQPVATTPAKPEAPSLPSLDESDSQVQERIASFLTEQSMKLLVSDDLVRRTVVFVDNLAQGKVAKKHIPLATPVDKFTALEDDIIITDPNSFERYTPYVDMLNQMSNAQIVRMYSYFKPLVFEAYEEIGYEGADFPTTLNEAIDELLATPLPETNLPLLQNSVTYSYAYPEWERLSDAQKQLLRMGPENMKKVQSKLTSLQKSLAQ